MKIAELRERIGLTRSELARALSVNERTVIRWEDGSEPTGLALAVLRAIDLALDEGADAARLGKRVAMGIGSLIYYGISDLIHKED